MWWSHSQFLKAFHPSSTLWLLCYLCPRVCLSDFWGFPPVRVVATLLFWDNKIRELWLFFWLLLVCCNASSNIDSVSPLLVLLMVSISAKIWRYGLWPLTWVALRRVFHVFMSQSNTRSDRVFWNYIVNMFSVLIRKIGGATGFSFCSICLHRCGGKNFSNTTSRSWVVGKKPWYSNFLFCFEKKVSQIKKLYHR